MFTILILEDPKKERRCRLKRPKPVLEECRTMDIPWRLIRAPCGLKGPDWKRIGELAGLHKTRLLFDSRINPPQQSGVRLLRLYGLQRILAAKAICISYPKERNKGPVGIIDPTGHCLSAAEILLEQSDCVMVHTHRPQRYEWFARRMLEKRGAPVILCQNPMMMKDCAAVLLGGECPGWQQWVPGEGMVFSVLGRAEEYDPRVRHSFEPESPLWVNSELPVGVPAGVLFAGLYELAACQRLRELNPACCIKSEQRIDIKKPEKFVSRKGEKGRD